MFKVFMGSWALFVGMFMLMVGNGIQGTLLGIRGGLEGFSTVQMSFVMSAYFLGFLGGSQIAPELIRRVGHVRVFAALGSTISAILILYPVLPEVWSWTIGRVIIGFCFSGVYVTAESWLNNAATNKNRGQMLSAYMLAQMSGIVVAQWILSRGDVSGFAVFIVPSVLVSLAFAPILLSVAPTPAFEATRPMSLRQLIRTSPLASMGMFLVGGVFAAQFGMVAVYGTAIGLSVGQISLLVSIIYVAALFAQYPIGWLSDRMDRRVLIVAISALGALGGVIGVFSPNFFWLLVAGALIGGTSNPLYALLIAYANDALEHEEMAAASAGFLFINGVGAILGPIAIGWFMGMFGGPAFWSVIVVLMAGLAAFGVVRMVQSPNDFDPNDTASSYAPVLATASPVAMEAAQEAYIEGELDDQDAAAPRAGV